MDGLRRELWRPEELLMPSDRGETSLPKSVVLTHRRNPCVRPARLTGPSSTGVPARCSEHSVTAESDWVLFSADVSLNPGCLSSFRGHCCRGHSRLGAVRSNWLQKCCHQTAAQACFQAVDEGCGSWSPSASPPGSPPAAGAVSARSGLEERTAGIPTHCSSLAHVG
uniref:Uncharacterized protein n=1 Tax=Pipistrellus kuhlii TaxID=59472 RepID=A0A7J7RTG7_PIPKU|nr:hypothetical protein mPipKuh1_010373 [Pipistrellus kuhlii]